MKECNKCHKLKDDEQFSPNKKTCDGLACHCKTCHAAAKRQYRWRVNKEKKPATEFRRMRMDRWMRDNPIEAVKAYNSYIARNAFLAREKGWERITAI